MDAIVAVSRDWGIGRSGRLLFSIPGDMAFFREKTKGAALIMGRSTLESLPGGRPLKGRRNIVLSTRPGYAVGGAETARSASEALELVKHEERPVFVIGGGTVYSELLPRCGRAYVTHIEADAESDTFFPNLAESPGWELCFAGERMEHDGIFYSFNTYVNRSKAEY